MYILLCILVGVRYVRPTCHIMHYQILLCKEKKQSTHLGFLGFPTESALSGVMVDVLFDLMFLPVFFFFNQTELPRKTNPIEWNGIELNVIESNPDQSYLILSCLVLSHLILSCVFQREIAEEKERVRRAREAERLAKLEQKRIEKEVKDRERAEQQAREQARREIERERARLAKRYPLPDEVCKVNRGVLVCVCLCDVM